MSDISPAEELVRIDEQLRKAMEGEAWHGPSVLEALEGVNAEQAGARPIPGAHTIWELVLHLSGTYGLVLRRLRGEGWELAPDEDWPEICDGSEENWQRAVEKLKQDNAEIRKEVSRFQVDRLDLQIVSEVHYTAYTQFIGLTQHDLYHAGQIQMLRKALAERLVPSNPIPAVVIFVSDVARVANFYQELASMHEVEGDSSYKVLEIDGFQLVIHRLHGEPETEGDGASVPREDSYTKFCIPVASLDAARAIAMARGGFIRGPEHEWEARGFRACDGNDPEGNIVQVRVSVPGDKG